MKEPLIFRSIIFDSRILCPGTTSYNFFNDDEDFPIAERINKNLHEIAGIEWMFQSQVAGTDYLFYEELDIGRSYRPYLGVKKPLIKDATKPGDIDILLINHERPEHSIAIQVKRLHGFVDENNVTQLKYSLIDKGIKQANFMYEKYRFHKNYLMLLIVIDTENRKDKQSMFRYADSKEKECVYEFSGFGDLLPDVGIYFYEVNQTTSKAFNHSSTLSAKTLRAAKPIEQMDDTTRRIKLFIDEHTHTSGKI